MLSTNLSALTSTNVFKQHVTLAKRGVRVVRRALSLAHPLPTAATTDDTATPTPPTFKYDATWMTRASMRFDPRSCSGPSLLAISGLPAFSPYSTDVKQLERDLLACINLPTSTLPSACVLQGTVQKEQAQAHNSNLKPAKDGEPNAKRPKLAPAEDAHAPEVSTCPAFHDWNISEARQHGTCFGKL